MKSHQSMADDSDRRDSSLDLNTLQKIVEIRRGSDGYYDDDNSQTSDGGYGIDTAVAAAAAGIGGIADAGEENNKEVGEGEKLGEYQTEGRARRPDIDTGETLNSSSPAKRNRPLAGKSHQRPGAYQGAPGQGLKRNNTARYSGKSSTTDDSNDDITAEPLGDNTDSGANEPSTETRVGSCSTTAVADTGLEEGIQPDSSNWLRPRSNEGADDFMLSATLVNEEEIVEAEFAPEGFKALMQNRKLKYIVAGTMLLLLGVIVPVVMLVPRSRGTATTVVVFQCGTAKTHQADYRGTINKTQSGIACQPWASQFPNSHDFQPEKFPAADLSENYCRNPDGDVRPWCFANRTGYTHRLYCSVPFCDGESTVNNYLCGTLEEAGQADYRGAANMSLSGKECLPWESWWRVEHYPFAGLQSNQCRNPLGYSAAWCFVGNNDEWEYCDVPFCEVMYFNNSETASREQDTAEGASIGESNQNSTDCGSLKWFQTDYRGQINETESGIPCQNWDSQVPHPHDKVEKHPAAGLDKNFCRNPDGESRAWCYTSDPKKRWEFCAVPDCPGADLNQCGTYDWKQRDYIGSINVTKSGLSCQHWSAQSPHFHYELPALMPEENLVGNSCRNPTKDERAWCYTSETDVIWEYCDVPFCSTESERQRSLRCGNNDTLQADYRGSLGVTLSGRRCQRWDTQFPHPHRFRPEETPFLVENYCRNPDQREKAWCITTDPGVYFEYCDVPYCEDLTDGAGNKESCSNCTRL